MGGVTQGRKQAASVLWAVSRGRRLDRAFNGVAGRLSPRDRAWVHEATHGVVRLRGRLDHLLDLHLKKGLSSLSSKVLDLLRLGAYQLLYMDGVPDYAAISQTVDQVKPLAGGGGSRLANGVLRSLGREGGEEARFPSLGDDPLSHFSTWGSHPKWMVERWLKRWEAPEVGDLIDWNNSPPPLFLRPLGISLQEAGTLLDKKGISFRFAGEGVPCLLLEVGTNPASFLNDFPGIIQDPGTAMVTRYADPPPGARVVDLCAAPGGKTLALAGEGLCVLAADQSLARMRVLKENLGRVGGRVNPVVADARKPPFKEASFVLLDVPCSGTGTLRRHPDARWRLTPDILRSLQELQVEILETGGSLVTPGGQVVYSTCTLEYEENEAQVENFLNRHADFTLRETGAVDSVFLDSEGFLRIHPQVMGFDGAFAARLERIR